MDNEGNLESQREMMELLLKGEELEERHVGPSDKLNKLRLGRLDLEVVDHLGHIWRGASFNYQDWRLPPKPRMRPMTRMEMIAFCANHPTKVVSYDGKEPELPTWFHYDGHLPLYRHHDMLDDGTWTPGEKFEKPVE